MICRAGQSAKQLRVVQPARIDHENLPWPLSVPWSGSFVSSQNPTRVSGDMQYMLLSRLLLSPCTGMA